MSRAAGEPDIAESVHLRQMAESVAARSAEHLLTVFRQPMDVEYKGGPQDLVTEHDLESERIIREGLTGAVPGCAIVGEEGGATGDGPVTWHVDPIDGTVNFAHGLAFWCISIAAVVEQRVVAGVISAPALGEVFAADLTGLTVDGRPARARRIERELDSSLISTFPRGLDLATNGDAALTASGELIRAYGSVRTLGRYVGCEAGVLDHDARTSWQRPAYFATAAEIEHPTLSGVVTDLTARAAQRA